MSRSHRRGTRVRARASDNGPRGGGYVVRGRPDARRIDTKPSSTATKGYTFDETKIAEELICKICLYPFQDPLVCGQCNHTFCATCLSNTEICPYCGPNNKMTSPPRLVFGLIDKIQVTCETCQASVLLSGFPQHLKTHQACTAKSIGCDFLGNLDQHQKNCEYLKLIQSSQEKDLKIIELEKKLKDMELDYEQKLNLKTENFQQIKMSLENSLSEKSKKVTYLKSTIQEMNKTYTDLSSENKKLKRLLSNYRRENCKHKQCIKSNMGSSYTASDWWMSNCSNCSESLKGHHFTCVDCQSILCDDCFGGERKCIHNSFTCEILQRHEWSLDCSSCGRYLKKFYFVCGCCKKVLCLECC